MQKPRSDIDEVIVAYLSGVLVKNILADFKINTRILYYWLNKRGLLHKRRTNIAYNKQRDAQIIYDHASGTSQSALAKIHKITNQRINQIVRHGLQNRRLPSLLVPSAGKRDRDSNPNRD